MKYKIYTFATFKHAVSGTDYIYNADSLPLSGSKPFHFPLTINPTPTSKNMCTSVLALCKHERFNVVSISTHGWDSGHLPANCTV